MIPSPHLYAGLLMLWRARQYAQDADADVWQFAVEISELRAAGLTLSDLRWLLKQEHLQHARETTLYGDADRSFRLGQGLVFSKRSAFVLTEAGAAFAQAALHAIEETAATPLDRKPSSDQPPSNSRHADGRDGNSEKAQSKTKPRWDQARRELSVGGLIVKRFLQPANCQERILAALEEEGWPQRLDDPLPPVETIEAKQRLRNIINKLNRNQIRRLLTFHGNGNGTTVCWRWTGSTTTASRPQPNDPPTDRNG